MSKNTGNVEVPDENTDDPAAVAPLPGSGEGNQEGSQQTEFDAQAEFAKLAKENHELSQRMSGLQRVVDKQGNAFENTLTSLEIDLSEDQITGLKTALGLDATPDQIPGEQSAQDPASQQDQPAVSTNFVEVFQAAGVQPNSTKALELANAHGWDAGAIAAALSVEVPAQKLAASAAVVSAAQTGSTSQAVNIVAAQQEFDDLASKPFGEFLKSGKTVRERRKELANIIHG